MKSLSITVFVFIFSLAGSGLIAQPLKTQSVSIFKNGTAFFVKSGEVKPTGQTWVLEEKEIPQALFGSLWFMGEHLSSVTGAQEEVESAREAFLVSELLKANIGKQVNILTLEKNPYQGEILFVNNSLLTLKNQARYETVPIAQITGLSFAENPEMMVVEKKQQKRIRLGFDSPQLSQNLQMFYLEKGIGWFPNYLIELTDEKNARLTLRAEIVNDAEDITQAEVNVVVGVPNFSAGNGISPLVGNQSLEEFMNTLSPTNYSWTFGNAAPMMNQSIGYYDQAQATSIQEVTADVEGSEEEDLYFYTLKNVTLAKGARAFYNIQEIDIPVAHIYEVNLRPNAEEPSYYSMPIPEEKNEVLHQIKITNPGKQPFTTGTAMVVKKEGTNHKPISQDMLNYTPAGGNSLVKITTAPDIKIAHKEEETSREENQLRKNRISYDRVSVAGEITVKNYKSKAVDLNIRRVISGELKNSSENWLKEKKVNLGQMINETTAVCWEIPLKAGEEKTIKYSYEVYVTQ